MNTDDKRTSDEAASTASKVLNDEDTGADSRSAAASTLAQRQATASKTSPEVASKASKVLRDGRTSESSKSAAASALSQAEGGTKGEKD